MWDFLVDFWILLVGVVSLLLAIFTSAHVVMYKRDTRAAIAWAGLVWFTPLVGSVLYFCFGINRIRRRAHALRVAESHRRLPLPFEKSDLEHGEALLAQNPNMEGLAKLVAGLTDRRLLPGNRVDPLIGGDEAFPAMLEAIDSAQHSVSLCTYIFDHDRAGEKFLDALVRAATRSVEVRVLIDDVGSRYSRPNMIGQMRSRGLCAESFLPTRVGRMFHYANLRNHRKIMITDGRVGFTGGMNIREGNLSSLDPHHPIQDVHFRLEGPVVCQLQEALAVDWEFVTGESLAGEAWFPDIPRAGDVFARGIPDGPDEDFEKLRLTILGALASAASSVCVVTPYFLPDDALITALNVAAMRGVEVDIVLPEHNNIRLVGWASMAMLWQVLERGCRVWFSPPPFDHTKLLIIDGVWTLLGSTNWDPRSLRLNFEFNVECYDEVLASRLLQLVQSKIEGARPVTLEEVESRKLPLRLRDGAARLFSPYL